MEVMEARQALQEFYDLTNPTEDDEFKYTEMLSYLIEETKDPKYMCELGWHYCNKKLFHLEIKYLEMAAEYGHLPAMEELGYMWYYGQHGQKDYEKAFYYFSKGAEGDKGTGSLWCKYKLADMYHNGYYVEKDEAMYRKLIEEAYEAVKDPTYLNEPYPEICLRLAGIRIDQGEKGEAVQHLKNAKRFLGERLSYDPFWGHIEVMGRIVRLLYQCIPFDIERADFYDLFYLTEQIGNYRIRCRGKQIDMEVCEEEGVKGIRYNGQWYRGFDEMCAKGMFAGEKLTAIYDEFYDVEVVG